MVEGFNTYQLVYKWNPNLPCTVSDELPALEGTTSSEIIASHTAREVFIAAEASEKIRTLKHKVRTTGKVFKSGEVSISREKSNSSGKGQLLSLVKMGIQ